MADSPPNSDKASEAASAPDAIEQAISKAQESLQSIADQAPGDIEAIEAAAAEPVAKSKPSAESEQPTSVFQCVSGSAIAGLFGYGAYSLTMKIATNFALHPFVSDNFIAVRISAAVRTLVVGMFTLATTVFGFAAIGLFALGIQTLVQKLQSQSPDPS